MIPHSTSRRQFIARAAAAGLLITNSRVAFGSQANAKIRLGVIGCGGRGTFTTEQFVANGGYEIAAAADAFQDKLDAFGDLYQVPKDKRFVGLDAYKQMLASGAVDAVHVVSPSYFHNEQAAAAVDAGKHVFVAKPIAIDVPGIRTFEETAKLAETKGLTFMVDFQTQGDDLYVEGIKRVNEGALGDLMFGEGFHHMGRLARQAEDGAPGARLRNWVFDKALSGDIIVEQNIHSVDVMVRLMNAAPVRVTGHGGRKGRVDVGDCWDHFALMFEFPGDVPWTYTSRQFDPGGVPGGMVNNLIGSKGAFLSKFGGDIMIRGGKDTFWRGGKNPNIYKTGTDTNISRFAAAIHGGDKDITRATVPLAVRSTLTAILGRNAAYQQGSLTWEELQKDTAKLEVDTTTLLS
ncbi:Gfo/Idh/MocA family protein [Prosthecobacter dejongeii]|uniref:Putative dehydrogenase n=1 Tax=Prosthecobacter dejongeii TaxID=48465 RepID=A0A7W8DRP7_9BACT|nr:Gfo/Idh/MocA family oxidoreductase [Prosthecobacter dejongeii]MBB5039723.1 putative dehydrogenase [Prosthecobacter dejongeii]